MAHCPAVRTSSSCNVSGTLRRSPALRVNQRREHRCRQAHAPRLWRIGHTRAENCCSQLHGGCARAPKAILLRACTWGAWGLNMQEDQSAKFRQSAAECATLANKARDPRAQAVLAKLASVWEKLADQRGYQRVSRHMVDLVYRLDATAPAGLVPVRAGDRN
jgi:hypothetical protein